MIMSIHQINPTTAGTLSQPGDIYAQTYLNITPRDGSDSVLIPIIGTNIGVGARVAWANSLIP
jgi:hypothetical protein